MKDAFQFQDLLLPPEHSQHAGEFIEAVIGLLGEKYRGSIVFDDRDIKNLTEFDLTEDPYVVADLLAQEKLEEAARHQAESDALDAESADTTRVEVVFFGGDAAAMRAAKVAVDHLAREFYGSLDPAFDNLQDTQNEPLKGLPRWCYVLEYVFSS